MITQTHMRFVSVLLTMSLLVPSMIPSVIAADESSVAGPYEKDFVITAYYSPLPDQCCYVLGGLKPDRVMNGNGTNGASGKEVFPGMIAAPKSYAFGTHIALPGIGIGTVHDRGGAIVEQGVTDRLDLWVGFGEEGLARALAFGVQRVRGMVYPNGTDQPADNVVLESLPAPIDRLKQYLTLDSGILDLKAKKGEYGYSVAMLQEQLKEAGYFTDAVTGAFKDQTEAALKQFNEEMGLATEPSDTLSELSAAYLAAAAEEALHPSIPMITPESSPASIKTAQRLMRYFGFYKGRTNGLYDDKLFNAILTFQQSKQLVGQSDSPGAGRIGPLTQSKLAQEWKKRMIAQRAENLLLLKEVNALLAKKGLLLSAFLKKGSSGDDVVVLQKLLAARGHFPVEKINGNFGDLTAQAVTEYQMSVGLIKSVNDKGAGTVGPLTMRILRRDEVQKSYQLVRGFGMGVL